MNSGPELVEGRSGLFDQAGDRVSQHSVKLASVVSLTLLYLSNVTLNEVKGLMYLERRDSSLRSE